MTELDLRHGMLQSKEEMSIVCFAIFEWYYVPWNFSCVFYFHRVHYFHCFVPSK